MHQNCRRIKVAFIITESEIGGAQSHVRDLYARLRNRIDGILVAGGSGPLFGQMKALGAQTVQIESLTNSLSPIHMLKAVRNVIRALQGSSVDFIHAHSAKGGAVARLAGLWLKIPVIYTVHGFGFKKAAPWKQRWAAKLAEYVLAPLTAQMICVSDEEARMARTLPIQRSRVNVIRNGVEDVHQRCHPDAPVTRVVMTARLAAPKRPDLLIQAMTTADFPTAANVVLAGDGPQRESLSRQAEEAKVAPRVQFAGNVDNIPSLLASAQLFVLLSDHEGLPISILEAMRAGLPIIASDLPGIREQLVHGESGWLVNHLDPSALADAFRTLSSDPALRQALGSAARRRYEQLFEISAMAEQTYKVFLRCVAARRNA